MLHILLLILKIIGIILAVIIGLLLLVILCIMFIPVRYRIKADGELGKEEPVHAEVKVSWLLHIFNVAFSYPQAAYLKIRIFCFTIFDSSGNNEDEPVKENKNKRKKHADDDISDISETEEEHEKVEATIDAEEKSVVTEKINADNKQNFADEQEEIPNEKNGKVKSFFIALRRFFQRLLDALGNIEYTIKKICDKIIKIAENIRYYAEVIQGDIFQAAFGISKKQLLRIIRTIQPRKCRITLKVGLDDPADTGQILAVYGMMYPFIGNNVFIQADFEEKVLEGDLYIKGRVTAFMLLWAAFRLYTDKNIRQLLKLLKREDA